MLEGGSRCMLAYLKRPYRRGTGLRGRPRPPWTAPTRFDEVQTKGGTPLGARGVIDRAAPDDHSSRREEPGGDEGSSRGVDMVATALRCRSHRSTLLRSVPGTPVLVKSNIDAVLRRFMVAASLWHRRHGGDQSAACVGRSVSTMQTRPARFAAAT